MELLLMLIILGTLFVSSVQPMFMMMSLIFIILFYSYLIYIMVGGYWFSYALMMVMLSGVLVIFTYMVTLIPNESFESYNFIYMLSLFMIMLGFYYIFDYSMKYGYVSLNLWLSYFSLFNVFMVSFLLGIMLIVVWMSYMEYGALRIYKGAWSKGLIW